MNVSSSDIGDDEIQGERMKPMNKKERERESFVEEKRPLLEDEEHESVWLALKRFVLRQYVYKSRVIELDLEQTTQKFPPNVVRNQKYRLYSFLFIILYEQFKYFFNMYFLLVALSQFIPALQVGFLFTYIAPLVFVLSITIGKEALDDYKRFKRDKEANSQQYTRLSKRGLIPQPSSRIKVGHMIVVNTNQRVPCDMILLRTTEKSGASFIRTDQLDGETDWKLRRSVACCQKLASDEALLTLKASVYVEKPKKDIYSFIGNFTRYGGSAVPEVEPLSVENTLWANTVVASGTVVGLAIYTGRETRSVMNTSAPTTKVGLLDLELNRLSKLLFGILVLISFIMTALKGFKGAWYIYFFRFLLLFSSIIPISLRVNLDLGKTVYSIMMMKDEEIPDTIVRSSTIPEELGRIEYLLSDKTGTLTQNDMVFKKLHLGTLSFSKDTIDEIQDHIKSAFDENSSEYKYKRRSVASISSSQLVKSSGTRSRSMTAQVVDAVTAIALCHNVTPVMEEGHLTYQASSPDEIALVKFTESVGLVLADRELTSITLRNPHEGLEEYDVLNIFPFTSETKRMGIIVREKRTGAITFYMKGADSVMAPIVKYNDWLEEECGNMAREGLRTLVFGKRDMSEEEFLDFQERFHAAKTTITNRAANVQEAIASIEHDLELVALSGVEDKLQPNVKNTLEMLRNASIRVWMLTGDKIETATCIAVSTKLVSRTQSLFQLVVQNRVQAQEKLTQFGRLRDSCLIIDGNSLQICMDHLREQFISIACKAPSVVCCRCSPTQKAEVVKMIRDHTKKQTCAIGDGGNDVSMIQAADVGIGIVGKEGKQASLAADFSITQFSYISRLILWHGRNSYKRSARLSQFVIHRGLIISFIQAVFSSIFYFAAIAIYNGFLMVGYSTIYTMAPVFSLVLDEDVSDQIAFRFPELYHELQKGRVLSYKTFCIWVLKSIYQGGAIMLLAIVLFESNLNNIVAITFTSLILSELINVAFEIHKWHKYMVLLQIIVCFCYHFFAGYCRSNLDNVLLDKHDDTPGNCV
jgi:phospholipid-translocating ATPase